MYKLPIAKKAISLVAGPWKVYESREDGDGGYVKKNPLEIPEVKGKFYVNT